MTDVITPVPRVLLSATLAGPAPSGGAGTSRLCQGCSRPPRHHPDQAALSSTAPPRQDGGEGLSPPLEPQRLTAQTDGLDGFREAQILLRRVPGRTLTLRRDQALSGSAGHVLRPGPTCNSLVITASLIQTPVVAGPTSWW